MAHVCRSGARRCGASGRLYRRSLDARSTGIGDCRLVVGEVGEDSEQQGAGKAPAAGYRSLRLGRRLHASLFVTRCVPHIVKRGLAPIQARPNRMIHVFAA